MRAKTLPTPRVRRLLSASVIASVLGLATLGGAALGADSRDFSVTVSPPSKVSQGGATAFTVTVDSTDNQTIANVKLSIPGIPLLDPQHPAPAPWPSALTITAVFGANADHCTFTASSVSCDLGNFPANADKTITVLASVPSTVPISNPAPPAVPPAPIKFSASAETNNENGSNRQVETSPDSSPLEVVKSDPNVLFTANRNGLISTPALGTNGAGNLQTKLNLLQDNGGKGNVVVIQESTSATQPAVCVTLKLTCQPDSVDLSVNGGNLVLPYLETVLTAKVPSSYNLKKAFVIHVLTSGVTDTGFPLFNSPTTSCHANPVPLPCADFSLSKDGILTITLHTSTNNVFRY